MFFTASAPSIKHILYCHITLAFLLTVYVFGSNLNESKHLKFACETIDLSTSNRPTEGWMVPHFVIWPDYMRTKHFTIIDVNRVTRLSGNGSHGQQLSRTFLFLVLLCPFREIRVAVLPDLRLQQPQEQRYPFLAVCVVFSFVQTVVWLPVFGNFNVCTDVDACDCTQGLYGHRKRVCTESDWHKNPLLYRLC